MSGTTPVSKVSTSSETGSATPIAYATWISHLRRESRRDDVLGHVTRHVAGRAVDLARVLAREGAAAMTAVAAVGIDDNFASGQSAIAMRSADDEAAGRIDVIDGRLVEILRRESSS